MDYSKSINSLLGKNNVPSSQNLAPNMTASNKVGGRKRKSHSRKGGRKNKSRKGGKSRKSRRRS